MINKQLNGLIWNHCCHRMFKPFLWNQTGKYHGSMKMSNQISAAIPGGSDSSQEKGSKYLPSITTDIGKNTDTLEHRLYISKSKQPLE